MNVDAKLELASAKPFAIGESHGVRNPAFEIGEHDFE